ncbi:hypothetical protein ILUMI_17834 [Ignelater luminosus]|uniref:Uncharacterized protein n=1 Tax=Ignelater luminosus TaxID=2038154 RepID=A0A8K0CJ60_IGNLU|nr:hypothetical protein ILUMI_17834 [Ignelater luminosus]
MHPGKQITTYNIASLASTAFINSFTPKNIISSFVKSGIYPINKLALSEEDSLCNYVSSRPELPTEEAISGMITADKDPTRAATSLTHCRAAEKTSVTAETVRPFLRQHEVRKKTGKLETIKSLIYTNTPEKNKLEETAAKRQEKKRMNNKRKQVKKDSFKPLKEDFLKTDVFCKLPPPDVVEATKLVASFHRFPLDFSAYNVM